MINILLIDDNSGFRHLLKEMLKESTLNLNIVEADNPIEGLSQFHKYERKFDFIITDFFLPIQNGNDFLEIVKSHDKNICCLLISADESIQYKNYPYVDHFFAKSDTLSLIKYLKMHSFLGI